jgi:arylsulfatase A-like enzyme
MMLIISRSAAYTAIGLCIFSARGGDIPAGGQRPNIIFLFADDWGRHAACYSRIDSHASVNRVLRTPNIDRLAAAGVLFRNAHVSAPSCTPCRSAVLSGRHFWRTGRGAILRGAVWDSTIPSFPLLLRDGGYHIGKTYKVWSPGTPMDAPFAGQRHSFERAGRRFNQFSQNVTAMVVSGTGREAAKQQIYQEIRANFRDFLKARPEGAPFCYWFGPTNTHRDWTKGSGKALWDIDPEALKGLMPPFLPDVPEVREDLADYFGEVEAWDAGVGVILEELVKSGESANTLVVVSGDHGAPGFPHGKCNLYGFGTGVGLIVSGPGVRAGRVVDDFVGLTDLAPTFLEAGSAELPAGMDGRSLWPLLKSKKEGMVDGTRNAVFTGRERHVEVARLDRSPYPQRAIRTARHALIINFHPERWPLGDPYQLEDGTTPPFGELARNTLATHPDEDAGPTKAWLVHARLSPAWKAHYDWVYGCRPKYELYDLNADPHETRNLAQDPAHGATRQKLEDRLMTELRRTGDPRVSDGGRYFETPPLAGPLADEEQFWKQKIPLRTPTGNP